MKIYIKSATSEELLKKAERAKKQEDEYALCEPVISKIKNRFLKETGFALVLGKYYYRADLESVLVAFGVDYNYGLTRLLWYSSPGRAKPGNIAMVSIHAANVELDPIIDCMRSRLIKRCIQYTFSSEFTLMYPPFRYTSKKLTYDDKQLDDYVINKIISETSRRADPQIIRQFISELLDTGQVVNNLHNL